MIPATRHLSFFFSAVWIPISVCHPRAVLRHSVTTRRRERGDPEGTLPFRDWKHWIPVFTGMTERRDNDTEHGTAPKTYVLRGYVTHLLYTNRSQKSKSRCRFGVFPNLHLPALRPSAADDYFYPPASQLGCYLRCTCWRLRAAPPPLPGSRRTHRACSTYLADSREERHLVHSGKLHRDESTGPRSLQRTFWSLPSSK